MRFLLTGFEPFGPHSTNPSWDALELAAHEALFEPDVHLARLPVSYAATWPAFEAAARDIEFSAALSFGLHGGLAGRDADTIYIETTARNRDGATKPDNDGESRPADAIVADAPAELPAGLPASAMLDALTAAGFAARLSDDAGAYLCNHLFFRAAHSLGSGFPYGFVHVPPVDSMGGVLTLPELARAMAVLVNAMAREIIKGRA